MQVKLSPSKVVMGKCVEREIILIDRRKTGAKIDAKIYRFGT